MSKIVVMLGVFLLSTNVFSQDPNFHIYICFGQSNMEGQGTIESKDFSRWRKSPDLCLLCYSPLGGLVEA